MKRSAFSLIEVLIATLLVGLAIVSLVAANSVFTQNNSAALDMSTAEYLIEQIRELTILLPVVDPQPPHAYFGSKDAESLLTYDDIGDFDDETFGPPEGPIDADRKRLSIFAAFTQKVTVRYVYPSNFKQVYDPTPPTPPSPFVRVTVDIYRHGQKVTSSSWIRAKY